MIVEDLKIYKKHPNARLPEYKTELAACADIYPIKEETIPYGCTRKIETGLVLIPPKDYHIEIYPRSSLCLKYEGLILGNCIGVIDSDYCGIDDELKLLLMNTSEVDIIIPYNKPIAQMRLVQNVRPRRIYEIKEKEKSLFFKEKKSRGGFGSTDAIH